MKKLFTSVLFAVVISGNAFSQQKTYFDENWEVTSKDKMEFYRESAKQGTLTLVKDFYKNGTLQMEGLVSDATPGAEVYEGKVTWYYPDGKIQNFGTFAKGVQNGAAQSFDNKGRLTEDVVYDAEGLFSGKTTVYKDTEYGSDSNTISEFKNGELAQSIVYDDDIKGIRQETIVDKKGNTEIKFYGDKGKYLGSKIYTSDYKIKGIDVAYYYNPMQISKFEKYGNDGEVKEGTLYARNGKVLQEEKRDKKSSYKRTYDENGKKIGELTYKALDDSTYLSPYDGVDYQYDYENTYFVSIDTYKEGSVINRKAYDDNGKLSSETFLENDQEQKINYYNENGSLKGSLTYKDGVAYDGTLYDYNKEQIYKNGILQDSKIFFEEGKLMSQKKFLVSKNQYETINYDNDGKIIFKLTQGLDWEDGFTADIVQYVNGKAANKSVIKDGLLQSGKIKVKTYDQTRELERSGKWIIIKVYDENLKLVQENKILIGDNQEGTYYAADVYIQEDQLLYSEYY